MKITAKQYALALYDLTAGKSEKELKNILVDFFDLLKKNNVLSRTDAILSEFDKIWNEENGILEARVVSARGLDEQNKLDVAKYIKNASGVKDVVLSEEIDKSIIGGIIMKYGDKVVDNSLKARVGALGRSLER